VLDPAVIASLRELTPPGEPDVLTEVLQLFLEDVPTRIARLRVAWQAGNAEELQRAAHSLKGSAGNIGARDLLGVCSRLDEQGRAGDLTGARDLVESVEAEYTRVAAEIQRLIAEADSPFAGTSGAP
jgi:HPt (histidine-containing phosphotransfer) domain-containing protein